jgi:hypothetical protein
MCNLFIIDNCARETLFHKSVLAHSSTVFQNVCELDAAIKEQDVDGMSFDCQLFVEIS